MTDDPHPPEPFVLSPTHNLTDEFLPGKGVDDLTEPEMPPKTWDTDLEDTIAVDPEMPDPTETDR